MRQPFDIGGAGLYYASRFMRQARLINRGGRAARGVASNRFEFTISKVIIYKPKLDAFLKTPAGPLWRRMDAVGRQATKAAKRQAGVKTGALRRSITMHHYAAGYGQAVRIESKLKYAYMHHEGTRPHIITPNRAKALRFTSGRRVIYTHMVSHPGTRPNRFLSNQIKYFLINL